MKSEAPQIEKSADRLAVLEKIKMLEEASEA